MKLRNFLPIVFTFVSALSIAQTPGLIYSRASGLGLTVLDPNNDSYTSLSTAGFSGTDFGSNSELNMIPMPGVVDEPTSDQSRGPAGGHTDLVNNGTNHSTYVLTKNIEGTDYFIVRFRLGGASSAAKAYSVAFDTDNTFGNYPTANNPGFEKEMVLETGNNGRVVIYTHSISGATVSKTYAIGVYSQKSIALSTINGDADYFYDFFVPFNDLGISSNVRMVAATVINSTSALTGNVSDVNGIDDQAFGNNTNAIFSALISSFPSTSLTGLTEGSSFAGIKSYVPSISGSITSSSTSISGTSLEANGTTITIYVNGVSIGTTTVTSNAWTYALGAPLIVGSAITATATASGKSISSFSSSTTVTNSSCYVARPTVTARGANGKNLSGTWPGTPAANSIEIKVYEQVNGALTFTDVTPSVTYVTTSGTFSTAQITNMGQGVVYYLTATNVATGCVSIYSEPSVHSNLNNITAAPSITTASVLASAGARTIEVQNLYTGTAQILIYVNGTLKSTSAAIAQNAINAFSISGLNEGDTITARAQASTGGLNLSGRSNKLLVSGAGGQSTTPTMNTGYIAGSGQTVSGTSAEAPGTSIYLYSGTTLIGTAIVNIYGNWSIPNLTLSAGNVLTAYADAVGKSLSAASTGVTVAAGTPTTPTVTTTPLTVGLTSISGTSTAAVAGDSIKMYVDGALLNTVVAGTNWSVPFNSNELYTGAEVIFVRTNSAGVSSAATTPVIVQGVVSFKITNTALGTLSDQISGTPFNIRIQGMSGPNGTGTVITTYTGNVILYSTASILSGSGTSSTFTSGNLGSHSMTLGSTGSIQIGCLNPNNPEAIGTVTINVTAAIFTGASSTEYATNTNWLNTTVPASGASIQLDSANTTKSMSLSGDLTLADITISTSNYQIVTNGHTLTVTGDLNMTKSGSIDASSGTIVFSGIESQTIPSNAFTNDSLQNITINNQFGVSLSDTLYITGVFTPNAGAFAANDFLFFASTDSISYGQIAVGSGTITGDVHFHMYITKGYHNIGSPVATTINDLNEGYLMDYSGYDWTANNSQWVVFDTSAAFVPGQGIFVYVGDAGGGYVYSFHTPAPIQFKGVPNAGNYTKKLYYHDGQGTNATFATTDSSGWNLLANPYPSNIDWDLSTIPNNTNSAIYIWDPANNRYTSYSKGAGSGTNGGSNYVPPAQGFFIETQDVLATDSVIFTFSDALRSTATNATFFKNGKPNPELYIEVTHNGSKLKDQTFIQFNEASSAKYDGNYDAKKFFNGAGVPNLYSIADQMYSINCMPGFDSSISIPLGFKCESATEQSYTINLAGINNMDGWQTIIEDKILQTKKVLNLGTYTFTHKGNKPVEDRFIIHFLKPESNQTAIDIVNRLNENFKIYQDYSNVYFSLSDDYSKELQIEFYDMSGRKLISKTQNINSNKGIIEIPSSMSNSLFIIKVQNGQEIRSLKVIR